MEACTLSRSSRVQLCETLWAVAPQTPLSLRFPRQEQWSGLHAPGDLPQPEMELMCACIAYNTGGFFTH